MGLKAVAGLNQAAVSITGGTITGTNIPYVWVHYDIPIIVLPTTTYNNNGAITLGTALGTTYANAYVVVPANSIAAGTPAATAIYFAQFSSTTVGTIFNNLLSANLDSNGGPTIPASPTAFATTGAGSVAGVTTTQTLVTLVFPASTIGTTGQVYVDYNHVSNNSATAKSAVLTFGGTTVGTSNMASATIGNMHVEGKNRNSASVQSWHGSIAATSGVTAIGTYSAIDTGANVNIVFLATHNGAATDWVALESIRVSALK